MSGNTIGKLFTLTTFGESHGLAVSETDPGVKGDTVSGGSKPAVLETGATLRVPLFIEIGDVLRIDTRSREYVSRAK